MSINCILNFSMLSLCTAPPPPLNVVASQASPSDSVEVSWSPPSGGATTITGYTIFYGNGANLTLPSVATAISLTLDSDYVGQTVSVCTEAEQLASHDQCTNTTVTDTGTIKISSWQNSLTKCALLQIYVKRGVLRLCQWVQSLHVPLKLGSLWE